eukprot:XP_001692435.1 predicted protein [Chlamydomonas reinhardtii]
MRTRTDSQANICAITAIEVDKQPLCVSAGWPGAHSQSTRAWASQARRLRADGMPRPCPRCHSNVFFEREPPPASSSSAASAASAPTASAAGGASSTPLGGGGGGEVVAWRSRPLCCDMCGAWVHMGCWSRSLRGPGSTPTCAGFNRDAIEGFGEPAREYDGGRYSAVLVAGRQPVAAASFNVWGREAQLCMLATATAARRKGHGAALVADVEGLLKRLGVQRMLVQARRVALPMWLGPRFGYSLVAPEAAEELHAQMPVAYFDCALLEKWL